MNVKLEGFQRFQGKVTYCKEVLDVEGEVLGG
jgi:hypothetical protein